MRYLYCKLSKSRKCVYFQMQDITSRDKFDEYLNTQISSENLGPNQGNSVVAFFDGLDEAYAFFREENPNSMEKAFRSIFFSGTDSKINKMFQAHNMNLECIVVSLRPEFMERSARSLTGLQYKNIYSNVYKIMPLSDHDAIKIFKSLRVLKRIEAWRKEMEFRHQNRYPVWWKAPYYTWLFRRILKNNPNCLFHYPMYIRYAYAFMQKYNEQGTAKERRSFSNHNIAVSFDILLHAIIKWEFHIYFENKSAKKNSDEMALFSQQIEACSEALAWELRSKNIRYLSKEQLESIIQQFFKDELSCIAMTHCFMVSDDEGKNFYFCHQTFYEYFLAKYLFEKGDYHCRKHYLYAADASDYLRAMYYSILCQTNKLHNEISHSIEGESGNMTLSGYRIIERQEWVEILDNPIVSMVEIMEYLPCIRTFHYRDMKFTQDALEALIYPGDGSLDLSKTNWNHFRYATGITPLGRIKTLNISGLCLCDPNLLRQCEHLKCLKMQDLSDSRLISENIVSALSGLSLDEIHIESIDGSLCWMMHHHLCDESLSVRRVYITIPEYRSRAYTELYRLKQEEKERSLPSRFYLFSRSNPKTAKEAFRNITGRENLEILTAVFELEADEDGILGLSGKDAEATYWNGMSLAVYYKYKDSIDEDHSADQICRRLEPYIEKTDSELSVRFGFLYGRMLYFHNEFMSADTWLTNTYHYGERYLPEKAIAECGVCLYRIRISAGNRDGLEMFVNEVENQIKRLPEYQTNWVYAFLLKILCADKLKIWQKGKLAPKEIDKTLTCYQEVATAECNHKGKFFNFFQAIYFRMLYVNRTENLELGKQTLEKLNQALKEFTENDVSDLRNQQALWIQYHEQQLYLALLTDNRKCILDTVEKLINYPHRRKSLSLSDYESIQKAYRETEHPNIDKHLLWNIIWF